jgi:hypothetical protein
MTRRQRYWRARADLIWVVVGFIVLQVGLAVASGRWLPELRDPHYGYKAARLRSRLTAAPVRPLCAVMVGSSRTLFGLRGTPLENHLGRELGRPVVVFNFGVFAGGPVIDRLTYNRLRVAGVRPDLLLIEVMPPYLAGQPGAPSELAGLASGRLWWGELSLMEHYGRPRDQLRRDWCQAWFLPWYAHRFDIISRVAPPWLPHQLQLNWGRGTDAAGWAPQPVKEASAAAVEASRRQYAGCLADFRLGGPSCLALEELLGQCRADGVSAALVLMPESAEFRSWYPTQTRDQLQAYLAALCRKYTAPVIDARDWVADADFSDGHHLLADGATVFSERLGPDVLRLLTAADRSSAAR